MESFIASSFLSEYGGGGRGRLRATKLTQVAGEAEETVCRWKLAGGAPPMEPPIGGDVTTRRPALADGEAMLSALAAAA
jgi:hypothetical protein